MTAPPFLSLDFLYVPSKDPDREIAYYTEVLGGTHLFRVKAMDTEVSAVRLSAEGLEIPHGPVCIFTAEGSAWRSTS